MCEALRLIVGEQSQEADDSVECVVHGEQDGLHATELMPGQVEVQHYTWGRRDVLLVEVGKLEKL